METLQQISDGSLEDIEFPGVSLEVKQEEGEDYGLPPIDELSELDPPLSFPEMDMMDENAPIRKKRLKKKSTRFNFIENKLGARTLGARSRGSKNVTYREQTT